MLVEKVLSVDVRLLIRTSDRQFIQACNDGWSYQRLSSYVTFDRPAVYYQACNDGGGLIKRRNRLINCLVEKFKYLSLLIMTAAVIIKRRST